MLLERASTSAGAQQQLRRMLAGRRALCPRTGLEIMLRPQHITAATIAEQLDLSRTTVSAVLSGRAERHRIADATVKRVLAAARKLNYRPNAAARQLAGKRSNSVGVLVTSEMMIDLRLIEAMEVLAAERGIRFIVGHAVGSEDQINDYLADFRSRGVDGLFSFFHHHPAYQQTLLSELLQFHNVVFYECPAAVSNGEVCYVTPDFFEVGRLGVQHLLAQGRQRIALVLRELHFPYARERRRAYEDVLADAGRAVDPNLIWVMTERTARKWTDPLVPELALDVVDELVVRRKADALVAVNDLFAGSLIGALRKRGRRIPDDVAVIGCDNLEFSAFIDPPITTIDLRLQEVAKALVGLMFDLLDKRSVPKDRRSVVVRPELVARSSA